MRSELSPAALTELVFAQLDIYRDLNGIAKCEKRTRLLRSRFAADRITPFGPTSLLLIAARKEVQEALAQRCKRCGSCPLGRPPP